jgi:hypothetical protein
MAPVQGTVKSVRIVFDAPPPDVQVAVQPPTGPLTVGKQSTGEVTKNADGSYTYLIDTTPSAGRWEYEVASVGGQTNVRKRRVFNVRPMLGPP